MLIGNKEKGYVILKAKKYNYILSQLRDIERLLDYLHDVNMSRIMKETSDEEFIKLICEDGSMAYAIVKDILRNSKGL